jgi:hypothetical protein
MPNTKPLLGIGWTKGSIGALKEETTERKKEMVSDLIVWSW